MRNFHNFKKTSQLINANNNGLLQPCCVSVLQGRVHMHVMVGLLFKPAAFSYLSGVASGIRLPEEGVGQLPHPHGQGGRLPGRLAGVHHGAEEGLQLRLRVPADVHDLLPGRRRAAVRVHVAKVFGVATKSVEKKINNLKKVQSQTRGRNWRNKRQGPVEADASGVMIGFVYTFRPHPLPPPPHTPSELFVSLRVCSKL